MFFDMIDLDHLTIRVHDLDAAGASFQRLGFTVTPNREPVVSDEDGSPEANFTANSAGFVNNRHVLFQAHQPDVANFFELMCVLDPLAGPPYGNQMMSYLLDSEGPKVIVGHSKDVERTRQAMINSDIQMYPPLDLVTEWRDQQRDRTVPIHARPAVPIIGQMPFYVAAYQTSTLDGYQYEPWTVHPNGARYLTAINGITNEVRRHAKIMANDILGVEPEYLDDDHAILTVRDVQLRIMSPRGFASHYPGLDYSTERAVPHLFGATVAVRSLDKIADILDANGIPRVSTPHGICVPRHQAHNAIIEFVAEPVQGK